MVAEQVAIHGSVVVTTRFVLNALGDVDRMKEGQNGMRRLIGVRGLGGQGVHGRDATICEWAQACQGENVGLDENDMSCAWCTRALFCQTREYNAQIQEENR